MKHEIKTILPKHTKKQSRRVTEKDLEVVMDDRNDLYRICTEKIGRYKGAIAMAHVQIEGDDPLRFFVKIDGTVIINPKILERSDKYTHTEGCMSFAFRNMKKVERYKTIKVECVMTHMQEENIDLSKKTTLLLTDLDAAMFQHEIGHFNLDLLY